MEVLLMAGVALIYVGSPLTFCLIGNADAAFALFFATWVGASAAMVIHMAVRRTVPRGDRVRYIWRLFLFFPGLYAAPRYWWHHVYRAAQANRFREI